ncbi:MAG: methylglyoxal synthase [Tissierellales bacterium]|jgi:methylglyoxal synthase|nr:methylglyoxal synthase [Tissierellales bacterium]
MKIALVAHDKMKDKMVNFTIAYENILNQHELFSTGTTGLRIMEATDLKITRFLSGPLGGDQQIGACIATDDMDMILFFRDPLTAQPHEPDILALMRLCDVHNIPLATNPGTAELLIKSMDVGYLDWRKNKK